MSEADGRGALADLWTRRCGKRWRNSENLPSLSPASRVFLSLPSLCFFAIFPLIPFTGIGLVNHTNLRDLRVGRSSHPNLSFCRKWKPKPGAPALPLPQDCLGFFFFFLFLPPLLLALQRFPILITPGLP